MKLRATFILLTLLALGSSSYALPNKDLTAKDVKATEYCIGGISEKEGPEKIYLGKHKSRVPEETSVEELSLVTYAFGDINGDGLGDAAVLVALNTGGTGQFMYLTAVLNDHGKPKCVAWESVGDRSICNSLKITDQKIICDMMTHGPDDSAIEPTVHRIVKYKLVKNKLIGPHDVQ
jgi:hypothetical protein